MSETALTANLGGVRNRIQRLRLIILLAMAAVLVAAFLLDVTTGPAGLGLADVVHGILQPDSLGQRASIVLWQVRLPDALIAVVVGAALGLAGVEMQTVLNNPLASPFTLGITMAAALGAAIAIVVQPLWTFIPAVAVLPVLAFLFAFGSALTILGLASVHGGATTTIVLYGIALVFLCEALVAALQYVTTAESVEQIVFWTVGNLTKAGWMEVAIVSAVLALILPLSMRASWTMTALRGGEEQARAAGIPVARIRILVILRASLLASVAVCFVGTIGFVGLVGPHIARMILGDDHRFLIPGACLASAAMLSLASFLSKSILPGTIIPAGIVTAIVGVPVFLVLIATRRGEMAWR